MKLIDSPMASESRPFAAASVEPCRVLVLGIGNVLMGDEGVGVHVLRQLECCAAMAGVRLLDGGTGGVNLLGEFESAPALILIDATRDGAAAGSVAYRYRKHGGFGKLPPELGAHDFGLKDLFASAAWLGTLPEIHLVTIAVETIRPMCTELSEPVAAAIPIVVALVQRLAERLAA
jgi:hydrogenase maturation protease